MNSVACGGNGGKRALCHGADRPDSGGKHLLDLATGVGVCARARSAEKRGRPAGRGRVQ